MVSLWQTHRAYHCFILVVKLGLLLFISSANYDGLTFIPATYIRHLTDNLFKILIEHMHAHCMSQFRVNFGGFFIIKTKQTEVL